MIIAKSDTKSLKQFALTMSWAFPVIFCGLLPWLFNLSVPWWPLLITTMMLLMYFVAPRFLYYPYRLWMMIAGVLGWINTRIILGLCFYLLIMPIGLVLRTFGKLQYKNRMNTNAGSNYVQREAESDKQNLEYPF